MSEKRFSETERNCYYTSLVFDNQTQEELGTSKVVGLLNEQQAIITELNKQIEQLNLAIDDLLSHTSCDEIKKENEQLRKELNDCEKFRYTVLKRIEELSCRLLQRKTKNQ